MLHTWRSRAAVSTVIALALAGGVLSLEAAHSTALPASSPAAAVAAANPAGYVQSRVGVVDSHRAATAAKKAAANRAAQQAVAHRAVATRVVAYKTALSRKGMSYSAGSAGPTAFDCSGFTSWVWSQAGHTIERTSYDQFATLTPISRSQARAGDLVFFFGGGTHHVGFYLGGNKMIHAANYGSGVIVTSLSDGWYADRISGFRRVV